MSRPEIPLRSYSPDTLPREIRLQIIAFMRQVWPVGFRDDNLLREWIHPDTDHPTHFVFLLPNGSVASHASAVWRRFSAYGEEWKIGGLSGVFTFAHVEGKGYGRAVIDAAWSFLEREQPDAALFCCDAGAEPFYRKSGWEVLPGTLLTVGTPPRPETGSLLFRSCGDRGDRFKEHLLREPLHFGDYSW